MVQHMVVCQFTSLSRPIQYNIWWSANLHRYPDACITPHPGVTEIVQN